MDPQAPSRTAMAAAAHRAAHQLLEQGRIFADPLAIRILGEDPAIIAADAVARPRRRGMRLFIAARSHFAESTTAQGIALRGVRQVVILGAGLDTFAYRHPHGDAIRVFEVDHPATQAWKRRRLQDAAIPVSDGVVFAPADFEQVGVGEALMDAGFDRTRRTAFHWLGVVPYLTLDAIRATLGFIAGVAGGGEVVFDYADPPESLEGDARDVHAARAARVAELNEPWLSYFEPPALEAMLRELSFATIEDLGPREIAARYWPDAASVMPTRGGHLVSAMT